MKTLLTLGLSVALALVLGGLEFAHERARLGTEQAAIASEWKRVDLALVKRAELVPALVGSLQSSLPDQAQVFEELGRATEALGKSASPVERIDSHNRISTAIGRLYVVLETHPELKSSDGFRKVQLSLESAENQVLKARSRYNSVLKRYNTDLALFPTNLVARIADFQREDAYFVTEPARPATPSSPNLSK